MFVLFFTLNWVHFVCIYVFLNFKLFMWALALSSALLGFSFFSLYRFSFLAHLYSSPIFCVQLIVLETSFYIANHIFYLCFLTNGAIHHKILN